MVCRATGGINEVVVSCSPVVNLNVRDGRKIGDIGIIIIVIRVGVVHVDRGSLRVRRLRAYACSGMSSVQHAAPVPATLTCRHKWRSLADTGSTSWLSGCTRGLPDSNVRFCIIFRLLRLVAKDALLAQRTEIAVVIQPRVDALDVVDVRTGKQTEFIADFIVLKTDRADIKPVVCFELDNWDILLDERATTFTNCVGHWPTPSPSSHEAHDCTDNDEDENEKQAAQRDTDHVQHAVM